MGILDAGEAVRIRLLLCSATGGEQLGRQLGLLAGELQALRAALLDPKLDNRLSSLGSALGLMAEVFRDAGPELALWCNDVLEVPPRRLARHLDVLAEALFLPNEVELPWPAYEPARPAEGRSPYPKRCVHYGLFLTLHFKSEITPAFLPFRAANFRVDFDPPAACSRKKPPGGPLVSVSCLAGKPGAASKF
jgi:hypothetical protein